jgi:hypothetical protein
MIDQIYVFHLSTLPMNLELPERGERVGFNPFV